MNDHTPQDRWPIHDARAQAPHVNHGGRRLCDIDPRLCQRRRADDSGEFSIMSRREKIAIFVAIAIFCFIAGFASGGMLTMMAAEVPN